MQSAFVSFLAQSAPAGFLSTSQWISLGVIVLVSIGLIVLLYRIKPAA